MYFYVFYLNVFCNFCLYFIANFFFHIFHVIFALPSYIQVGQARVNVAENVLSVNAVCIIVSLG